MSFLSRFRRLVSSPALPVGPQIAIFGDSHTAAMFSAKEYPDRAHHYGHIRIYRLLKEKNGRTIGDVTLEEFCTEIAKLRRQDFVFSAAGGNQYAVVSTVQSPVDFDFLTSPADEDVASVNGEIVPFRAFAGHIERGVRGTLGPVLTQMRAATSAKLLHLAPPPPKQDNAFIATHFESRFARAGLRDLGPTRPSLRLKAWKLQLGFLSDLCAELGVELMMPPARTVTDEGYLAPRCYAKDVTHANRRYGEYVLKDILKVTDTGPTDPVEAA
jgi:hypothetical protein